MTLAIMLPGHFLADDSRHAGTAVYTDADLDMRCVRQRRSVGGRGVPQYQRHVCDLNTDSYISIGA